MTEDTLLTVLHQEIRRLAPEVLVSQLKPTTRIREDLDLDSFDFLRLVAALHARLQIDVPDIELQKLRTIGECVDYFSKKV